MDCDEPHLAPNEKMHPIQWTERPTGALVAAGSLCPALVTICRRKEVRCNGYTASVAHLWALPVYHQFSLMSTEIPYVSVLYN
jgi:hypothetical protein